MALRPAVYHGLVPRGRHADRGGAAECGRGAGLAADARGGSVVPRASRRPRGGGRARGGSAPAGLAAAVRLWLPRALRPEEREHLVEHAALARMVADPTLLPRQEEGVRERLRQRWTESEAEVRALLQRAYYEGQVLGPGGRGDAGGRRACGRCTAIGPGR